MLFDLHGLETGPLSPLHIGLAFVATSLLFPDFLQRRWTMTLFIAVSAFIVGLGRVVMEIIPSVQPITPFVFILGVLVGSRRASSCAIFATLISNFELGMGVWTLYQAIAWCAIGCLGAAARPHLMIADRLSLWHTAVLASLLAFPFGWIVSLPALEYGVLKYVEYLWNGLLFDIYHAVGNALFITVMVPIANASLASGHRVLTGIKKNDIAIIQ